MDLCYTKNFEGNFKDKEDEEVNFNLEECELPKKLEYIKNDEYLNNRGFNKRYYEQFKKYYEAGYLKEEFYCYLKKRLDFNLFIKIFHNTFYCFCSNFCNNFSFKNIYCKGTIYNSSIFDDKISLY